MTAATVSQDPVLIVEGEVSFAAQIQETLSRWGHNAVVVGSAEQAEGFVAQTRPALVLLCVELPGRSGYSVCNKLKKSERLQSIPIIIMSSQATPEVFARHREMKVRADDYVIKPIAISALLERVGRFIELPEGALDELGEIELADVGESTAVAVSATGAGSADQEIVVDGMDEDGLLVIEDDPGPHRQIDRDIEAATDAAFAAIAHEESPSPQRAWDSGAFTRPSAAEGSARGSRSGVHRVPAAKEVPSERRAFPTSEIELERAESLDRPLPDMADDAAAVTLAPLGGDDDAPAVFSSRVHQESGEIAVAQGPSQARLAQLEAENRRLQGELEAARSGMRRLPTGSSGSSVTRDREVLSLREVINKKEKELLDLKDDLDAKERQVFEQRDKARQLEHRLQERDDKLLGVEKEFMGVRERTEALEYDKKQAQDREAALKVRLDQAKAEINKAYKETDQIKARYESEAKQAQRRWEGQLEALRQTHEAALGEAEDAHRFALDGIRGQTQRELEEAAKAHQDEVAQQQQAHQRALDELRREMRALEQRHKDQLSGTERRHREELAEREKYIAEEREALTAQAEAQQREQEEGARAQREALQAKQAAAIAALQASHAEALAAAEQRHAEQQDAARVAQQSALDQREAEHAGEKETLRRAHQDELSRLKNQHAEASRVAREETEARVAELHAQHDQAEAALKQAHAETVVQLEDRVQELTDSAGDLKTELTTTRAASAQHAAAVDDLTQRAAVYQERLVEAYNKIRHDEELADKVKRALAIGIALVEEHQKVQVDLRGDGGGTAQDA